MSNLKTRPCQYFLKGTCTKGDKCDFLHTTDPKAIEKKPCRAFQTTGSCQYGSKCNFLHAKGTSGFVGKAPVSEEATVRTITSDDQISQKIDIATQAVEQISNIEWLGKLKSTLSNENGLSLLSTLNLIFREDSNFDLFYAPMYEYFVNLLVNTQDADSFANFTDEHINNLIQFLKLSNFNQLSSMGAILHFSEGSFRSRSTPQWHANIRVDRQIFHNTVTDTSCSSSTSLITNDVGLVHTLQHMHTYAQQPIEITLEPWNAKIANDIVSKYHYFKFIPKMDINGSKHKNGLHELIRVWDGMCSIAQFEKRDKETYLHWYPRNVDHCATHYDIKTKSTSHYKNNTTLDHENIRGFIREMIGGDETRFYIQYRTKHNAANPLYVAIQEKTNKLILSSNKKITATFTEINGYLAVIQKKAASTTNLMLKSVTSERSYNSCTLNKAKNKYFKEDWEQLLKLTYLLKKLENGGSVDDENAENNAADGNSNDKNADNEVNVEGLTLKTTSDDINNNNNNNASEPNTPKTPNNNTNNNNTVFTMTVPLNPWKTTELSSDLQSLLLYHPFLPIIGIRSNNNNSNNSNSALLTLQHVRSLLSHLELSNTSSIHITGCQVVFDIVNIRTTTTTGKVHKFGYDTNINTLTNSCIPGYGTSDSFPQSNEWDEVTAFVWFTPIAYYTCPTISVENKKKWMDLFEIYGSNYPVNFVSEDDNDDIDE